MVAHTPTEREIYEANLKALRDERSRLKTAINQGRIEGREEECRSMLLQLGQLLMGPLTPQQRQRVDSIPDYETLQRCVLLLHPSRKWDEILNEGTASLADN